MTSEIKKLSLTLITTPSMHLLCHGIKMNHQGENALSNRKQNSCERDDVKKLSQFVMLIKRKRIVISVSEGKW